MQCRGIALSVIAKLVPIIFLSQWSAAALVFPPDLNTDLEYAQREVYLRELIPETVNGPNSSYRLKREQILTILRKEQDLLKSLKADHEYMAAAAERPPLKVLRVQKIEEVDVVGFAANAKWDHFLSLNTDPHWSNRKAAEAELTELLQTWTKRSSSGFFSGLAAILKGRGRDLLNEPDLELRWQNLRSVLVNQVSPEELAQFRAKDFGITASPWKIEDLDLIVSGLEATENRIMALIQALAAPDSRPDEQWLFTDDIGHWLYSLKLDPLSLRQLKILQNRAVALYADKNVSGRKTNVVRELTLRELTPWEAIYRGAVGGDCSTNHSWPFPYSPFERNWWIENEHGFRIGYVSGNITRVNGRPTLYIRDVRMHVTEFYGAVTLILEGFYKARHEYGAEGMTVMPVNFTNQNANLTDRAELINAPGGANSHIVHQVFDDAKWRSGVFTFLTQNGMNGAQYDNISAHSDVRELNDHFLNPNTRVQVIEQDAQPKLYPKNDPDAIWNVLASIIVAGSQMPANVNFPNVNWPAVIDVLKNTANLKVEEFYAAADRVFNENGLEISRNLIKKNEAVFLKGFLEAPDAFEGDKNMRQAVRYVLDLLLRGSTDEDIKSAAALVGKHLYLFENNEIAIRGMAVIFKRHSPQDSSRVHQLLDQGYRFTKSELTAKDWSWIASTVNDNKHKLLAAQQSLATLTEEQAKDYQDESLQMSLTPILYHTTAMAEEQATKVAAILYRMNGLQQFLAKIREGSQQTGVKSAMEDKRPVEIRYPVALAILRNAEKVSGKINHLAWVVLHQILHDEQANPVWLAEAKQIKEKLDAHVCESELMGEHEF